MVELVHNREVDRIPYFFGKNIGFAADGVRL
jgi:hypothetical protein